MSAATSVARTLGFTALYLAATVAGRMTVMDGSNLSLVWPAAGVAVVWFCAQRRARWRWLDVAALTVVSLVVNTATGAAPALAAAFAVANLVQVGAFLALFARLCPHLWGAGGDAQMNRTGELWRLLVAAFVSTSCGALIGPTAVWLATDSYALPATMVWLTRNTASVLLVGAVGLRLGALLARPRPHRPVPAAWRAARAAWSRATPWRITEYAFLVAFSASAYLLGFALDHGLPLAFALMGATVWAALRMPTTFVVLHDMVVGSAAILFTLNGTGPFAVISSYSTRALVAQAFVGMVAVLGLALALGRDERDALLTRLVTREREASDHAGLMTAIVESMSDGLAVIDATGQVVLRNPAAAKLLGGRTSPSDMMADSSHYGLFHLDGRRLTTAEMPYARALAGDDTHDIDLVIRNAGVPDARIVRVTATALPENTRGTRMAVVLFHDVTEERRHRDELMSFAGVVAHDLLNPLTTIDGWSHSAEEALADAPAHAAVADAVSCLARVYRAADRMRDLINDLLAYTTARDAGLAPADVDLRAFVADIAVARTDLAAAADAPVPRFTVGDLHRVHADPVLVRQLLDNLISNAVKYTAPGVTPRITVGTAAVAGNRVRVEITDNGIGIPAGQHEAVFGNFHRAHAGAGYTGTGLGLAICRRIVQRHGGTIAAAGDRGGGTRITLTLPAADQPPRAMGVDKRAQPARVG
ncbi:MAG TPA: ATP-binding protein [Pilimelia sp.]|nr:ATP-binding protein [Pilimelia sp.]